MTVYLQTCKAEAFVKKLMSNLETSAHLSFVLLAENWSTCGKSVKNVGNNVAISDFSFVTHTKVTAIILDILGHK